MSHWNQGHAGPVDPGQTLEGYPHVRAFGRALVVGGESSQWWGPMGVAVIWGLAVATFLTLVVVPVMYSTLDPIKRFFVLIFWGMWQRSPK